MSLNKFMHPRNRYKISKPSFLHLALKYPEFRAHTTQDEKGKVFLDFKNADALRALTTCLLKEDFGLSIELPTDRLVPTLPLRLNYIHWLEDILGTNESMWGIDVGTGASCIYPILAVKMNKWHFLATEADPENLFYANKNITNSGFQDVIHVKQVSAEDILIAPLQSSAVKKFDFCMCNPPFFADIMEAQALTTTRSVDRPDANSVSTASPQECIAQGGEVGFIRQMIEESTVLRDRIRVYTSMVGKKTSLAKLKAELLHQKVEKFSTTQFCQGKTMRWGIAWTFDHSVTFPRSEFDSRKEKPPLQFMVPQGAGGVVYKVHEIAAYLKELLESLKVHCYQGKKAKSYTSITLTAVENTWCHQRRLRRQQQYKSNQDITNQDTGHKSIHDVSVQDLDHKNSQDITIDDSHHKSIHDVSVQGPEHKNSPDIVDCVPFSNTNKAVIHNDQEMVPTDAKKDIHVEEESGCSRNRKRLLEQSSNDTSESVKRPRIVNEVCKDKEKEKISQNENKAAANCASTPITAKSHSLMLDSSIGVSLISTQDVSECSNNKNNQAANDVSEEEADSSPKEYILKCVMRLKRVDEQVQLELEWLDGQSRELMHQIMTFLKNKLVQSKK